MNLRRAALSAGLVLATAFTFTSIATPAAAVPMECRHYLAGQGYDVTNHVITACDAAAASLGGETMCRAVLVTHALVDGDTARTACWLGAREL